MRTFAELLSEHMRRAGISDTELARTLGVRRQTIFRWKEGLVERPRHREDVLQCADRLRLTADERDDLLLAAGFSPETPASSTSIPPPLPSTPESEVVSPAAPLRATDAEKVLPAPLDSRPASKRSLRQQVGPRLWLLVPVLVLLVIAGGGLFLWLHRPAGPTLPTAASDETLILVAPLGRAGQPVEGTGAVRRLPAAEEQPLPGVQGRIVASLAREIQAARLERVRAAAWPEEITTTQAADAALRRSRARMVLWGTPAGDKVMVFLRTSPLASTPEDLSLDALVGEPGDVACKIVGDSQAHAQVLALLVTSRLYLERGSSEMARAALTQAIARSPEEPEMLAVLDSNLGYVAQVSKPANLDQAIQLYSKAIDLAPDAVTLRVNRGAAYVRQNKQAEWQADLTRAFALEPNHLQVRQSLCWAYALDRQPEQALSHCDAAVSLDSTGRSREGRSVVYAELGRLPEARSDLQAFLAWLGRQPALLQARYGTSRQEWLQAIEAGQNPIDDAVLQRIRQE